MELKSLEQQLQWGRFAIICHDPRQGAWLVPGWQGCPCGVQCRPELAPYSPLSHQPIVSAHLPCLLAHCRSSQRPRILALPLGTPIPKRAGCLMEGERLPFFLPRDSLLQPWVWCRLGETTPLRETFLLARSPRQLLLQAWSREERSMSAELCADGSWEIQQELFCANALLPNLPPGPYEQALQNTYAQFRQAAVLACRSDRLSWLQRDLLRLAGPSWRCRLNWVFQLDRSAFRMSLGNRDQAEDVKPDEPVLLHLDLRNLELRRYLWGVSGPFGWRMGAVDAHARICWRGEEWLLHHGPAGWVPARQFNFPGEDRSLALISHCETLDRLFQRERIGGPRLG